MPSTRDLSDRFLVVTGANVGIGRSAAEALAARGASVVLACRSEEKTRPVLDALRASGADVRFEALDLGDFESVRACAARLVALGKPIDVLLNNAGVAGQRGATKQGFELHFGTNHLGTFLFTMLLADRVAAGRGRVVNVASQAHYDAPGIDFEAIRGSTRSITGLPEYAVSKLANVLFSAELARRIAPKGVRSYSLHPGVVATDAWRRIPWPVRPIMKAFKISSEEGAKTSLYCATSPEAAGETGLYYDSCKPKVPSAVARDEALARKLWEKSVEIVGADLP
jgi:NAD(P)-dependent dehydrogenase (short-subunit alcohol dehydrogenase family)